MVTYRNLRVFPVGEDMIAGIVDAVNPLRDSRNRNIRLSRMPPDHGHDRIGKSRCRHVIRKFIPKNCTNPILILT